MATKKKNDEPTIYGSTDLSYNEYLKIPELVGLQKPQSKPAHHDELLFIIIHQAYELWFKLILHEMEKCIEHLKKGEALKARHFLRRVVEVMKLLVNQIHILETMTPADFLKFRDRLKPASGFQSLQFREIEFLAGLKDESYFKYFEKKPEIISVLKRRAEQLDLKSAYFDMLHKIGFKVKEQGAIRALLPIYQNPDEHLPLYLLTESLVEFDEYLNLWREHHVRVVERIIGFKQGTGGSSGVHYLRTTLSKKCFPELWELRTMLV